MIAKALGFVWPKAVSCEEAAGLLGPISHVCVGKTSKTSEPLGDVEASILGIIVGGSSKVIPNVSLRTSFQGLGRDGIIVNQRLGKRLPSYGETAQLMTIHKNCSSLH